MNNASQIVLYAIIAIFFCISIIFSIMAFVNMNSFTKKYQEYIQEGSSSITPDTTIGDLNHQLLDLQTKIENQNTKIDEITPMVDAKIKNLSDNLDSKINNLNDNVIKTNGEKYYIRNDFVDGKSYVSSSTGNYKLRENAIAVGVKDKRDKGEQFYFEKV